jgi:DNA (cytosine-5)-methyltransferase 1
VTLEGKLVCVDLFAGCGGLSLGLELAGFTPLLFCELNKSAGMTYMANRPFLSLAQWVRNVDDLLENNAKLLRKLKKQWDAEGIEIDLVCGGPPCQGFSGIGHRRTFAVEKDAIPSNHLFKRMVQIIRILEPKMFLFENVKGIMSGRWTASGAKGEIWRDVQAEFKKLHDIGYHVPDGILLSAADYGVPQNRPRVLIAGYRGNWDSSIKGLADGLLPKGTDKAPNIEDILGDLVDPKYRPGMQKTAFYPSEGSGIQQWYRKRSASGSAAHKGEVVTQHEYSKHSDLVTEKFRHMLKHGFIAAEHQTKKFAQRVLPARWDMESPTGRPTITVTSLPDDYVHYKQPRTPTVREWARLQTFPDWYEFVGPRTTGGHRRAGIPTLGIWDREVPQYTQIGNAVPVKLALAIGKHFKKILQAESRSEE